jgi:hypothetical protein
MAGWVIVKHDGDGHERIVSRHETPEDAAQQVQVLRRQLPRGSSDYFTTHEADRYDPQPLASDDQYRAGSRAVPKNCNDIRREVAKQPYRAGERAYIIRKAIELGCTDNIPDGWMIQFRRTSNE